MVSATALVRYGLKLVGVCLLAGSSYIAYQLATTSFTTIPTIGVLVVFFTALMVVGSFLLLFA
ncbi:MAG: hypothetical protein QW614_01430 [Candidatus Caldarchaeum sp.]|uniref:Uncharacterized protein n=1 Tax=Caldiarchaeum subterraneum TaxID=311458 RepID=A0A7C5LCD3_CALS0